MRLLLVVALLILAAPALGQEIDTYEIRYYAQGASAPTQTQVFSALQVACGPDAVGGPSTNPTAIVWDDPDDLDHVCRYDFTSGDTLWSLPVGSYEATLVAKNAVGASQESNRAPFLLGSVPMAPSGVRLVRR